VSSSLSILHLHFLKGTLGVKRSTTNWAVLRECEPLQFYWFWSAVKLFNSMLNTISVTLRRVFSTLVDFVSPANCHQPESRAVGHPFNPLVTPFAEGSPV
jgi:hypothetical protein